MMFWQLAQAAVTILSATGFSIGTGCSFQAQIAINET
jgi:hypothetical protein